MSLDALKKLLDTLSLDELRQASELIVERISTEELISQTKATPAVPSDERAPSERRSFRRFSASFPCRLVLMRQNRGDYSSAFLEGYVSDISRGGAKLITPRKLARGEPITLYLQPNEGTSKRVYGVIVRAIKAEDGWESGVEYVDYDEVLNLARSSSPEMKASD